MKTLLLYLRTGGGHLAPARAVDTYIGKKHAASVETALVDGLEGAGRLARFLIEDGYRILQSKARWYYEFLYATNKFLPLARWNVWLTSRIITPILTKKFFAERPDKVVIFHFMLIKPTYDALRRCGLDIPVITVVTDPYTAHPIWFLKKDQRFIVFSEELKRHCIRKGIPEDRVKVFPFVLSEQFSHPPSPEKTVEVKQRLGFLADTKVVLIMGGGDGIPRGRTILANLLPAAKGAQIAIVCGKNRELLRDAMAFRERGYPDLKVYGFVDFVYDLISCADVVITKCGASTFMEILMLGKIPVVTDYIWEQEKGNVEFLVKNKMGFFEHNLAKLPSLVDQLITDDAFYRSYHLNIVEAHLRNGTPEVAEWIVQQKMAT